MDLIEDAVAEGFREEDFLRRTFCGDFNLSVGLFQFGHDIPLNWGNYEIGWDYGIGLLGCQLTFVLPGQSISFCVFGTRVVCNCEVESGEE